MQTRPLARFALTQLVPFDWDSKMQILLGTPSAYCRRSNGGGTMLYSGKRIADQDR
jgi:hypothetical protein